VITGAAIGACWGLFVVVWVAGAVYNARHGPAVAKRPGLSSTIFGALIATSIVVRALPASTWSSVTTGGPVRVGGALILVAGTGFTVWARTVLGTMWSSTPVAKDDHELRRTGPYAITRHPIYTGILTMVGGTALANGLGAWILVFVACVVAVEFKLRAEERLMLEVFGADYDRYRREVPQLVPRLSRRSRV
jgi:protein-S-isoprenylcysteine O-methyltransferase Ste14